MSKMFAVLMLCFFVNNAIAASFDCNKAINITEKTICSDDNLSRLDVELSSSFKQAKTSLTKTEYSELSKEQKKWLKVRNECCSDKACIARAYQSRIGEINNYTNRSIKIIKFNNLERFNQINKHNPLEDKEVISALKLILKKDYYTFKETMRVIEMSENLVGDDGVLRVYGAMPHLYTIAEAALIIEPAGNIYVAILDGGEKILYYTNNKKQSKIFPKEFIEWSERFSHARIIYKSQ